MIKFNHFQAAMMALLPLIAMVTYQSINYVNLAGHTTVLKLCRKFNVFEIMIMNVLEKNLFLNHNKYGCPLCDSDTNTVEISCDELYSPSIISNSH